MSEPARAVHKTPHGSAGRAFRGLHAALIMEHEVAALRRALEAANLRDAERDAAIAKRDAEAAAMRAEIERLRLAAAAPAADAASAGGGAAAEARASRLSMPHRNLASPSDDTSRIVDGVFCAVVERPVAAAALGITVPAPSIAAAFRALLDAAAGDSSALASEANFYARSTSCLPAFAESVGGPMGNMEASVLFTDLSLETRAWSFARKCLPELHVRAALSAARPFRPAFNGEVKSVGPTWLQQAVYYTAMDMVRIFFPALADGAAPGLRRFFSRPPLGFALVTFPHVGYIIALEWVGVLFVSPVSAPFFIGSAEHAAALAGLPDVSYTEPEVLDESLPWRTWSADVARGSRATRREAVSWSVAAGRFRKLVRADARSPARFRALYDAYERVAALAAEAAAAGAPRALAAIAHGVRLRFGAHELLIEMAALEGARDATDDEVATAGAVLEAAAAAVAWLATRCLLYVDLRGPNVLVAGAHVWLVDYDDLLVLNEPVCDVTAFRRALSQTDAAATSDWAGALNRGALPDVLAALAGAFDALAARSLTHSTSDLCRSSSE